MEENKNKIFNLLNYLWIIPLIIGVIVGFNGISKINEANNMYIPPMSDDGWFDATTTQATTEFSGYATCIFGFFVIGIIGTIICYAILRSIKMAKKQSQSIGSAITNIITAESSMLEEQKEKLKECIYCGSLQKKNATECDSCGGKKFKKHKH